MNVFFILNSGLCLMVYAFVILYLRSFNNIVHASLLKTQGSQTRSAWFTACCMSPHWIVIGTTFEHNRLMLDWIFLWSLALMILQNAKTQEKNSTNFNYCPCLFSACWSQEKESFAVLQIDTHCVIKTNRKPNSSHYLEQNWFWVIIRFSAPGWM